MGLERSDEQKSVDQPINQSPRPRDQIIVDFRAIPGKRGFRLLAAVITPLPEENAVRVNNGVVDLEPKQSELLKVVANNPNVTIPVDVIKKQVWPGRDAGANLYVQVLRLRKKLSPDPEENSQESVVIQIKRDVGYRFGDIDPTVRYNQIAGEVVDAEQIGMLGGRIMYYPDSQIVLVNGRLVELKDQEGRLLTALNDDIGQPVTTDVLSDKVSPDKPLHPNAVDLLIHKLRGKIEPDPANPTFIHTDRDLGYRLGEMDEEKAQQIDLLGGRIKFALMHRYVEVDGVKKVLDKKGHELLLAMYRHFGEVVTRDTLLREVWKEEQVGKGTMEFNLTQVIGLGL